MVERSLNAELAEFQVTGKPGDLVSEPIDQIAETTKNEKLAIMLRRNPSRRNVAVRSRRSPEPSNDRPRRSTGRLQKSSQERGRKEVEIKGKPFNIKLTKINLEMYGIGAKDFEDARKRKDEALSISKGTVGKRKRLEDKLGESKRIMSQDVNVRKSSRIIKRIGSKLN